MKYIFTIFLFFTSVCFSQNSLNFDFRKIQVDEGLSENTIYSILQDSKGFMWFGTKDGLNRFDGINFRVFRHDTHDLNTIGNNFIRSMVQGTHDTFYVGTDGGLFIMDAINESFQYLEMRTKDGEKITTAVNTLLIDKNGKLWIGTMFQGVFVYDPIDKQLQKIKVSNYDLGQNAVWKIYEDKSGVIWVGSRLGLLRFNRSNNKLEAVEGLFKMANNSDNEVLSILEDTKGNLWLGTWSTGLRLYNKYTNSFVSFFDSNSKDYYITHIRALYQYSDMSFLIGSDDGLYLFDTNTHSSKRIDNAELRYNLSDQNIYSIASDRENGIWFGTYFGGINYLNTSLLIKESYYPSGIPSSLSGKAVSQFCEDESGNLWIATEDGGVNYFNPSTKLFTQPVKTSYHNTHALLLDGDNLWIGTFSRGVDIYNTKTGALKNIRSNTQSSNTLNDDCVFSIYKTKKGDIYVGTPVGLNKYNEMDASFTNINEVSGFIYDMKEDEFGNLWVASYGSGVIKYDSQTQKWNHYNSKFSPENPIVQSKLTGVYIDSQKRVWFSSEGRGIFLYNYQTDNFSNISEADGLPNNVVYGILDDQFGNLWLSCNKGLVRFNLSQKNVFQLYGKEDGLQCNQFNFKSSLKTRDGKFYFGGINGFNAFYPQDIILNPNDKNPPVEVTHLRLLASADPKMEHDIQTALNAHRTIELPYNKSSFTISYVALSYVSPVKNQYAYKLLDIDKDWNYVGNTKTVTYVNLPPGKYVFTVKANSNNGIWSDVGTEINIEILPPFWLSLPAKIFYLLLVVMSIYLLGLFVSKRTARRQEKQLENFKSEQETLAFKSKIDFFTTIAHEIRTPLSLIKAPLEEVLIMGLDEDDAKQNLYVIERNCERLTVLINQLLDFRKMDSSTYFVNPEKINVKQHFTELYERFKKTTQSKKINFELRIPSDFSLTLMSDADALTKIAGNLLTNAMKFTTDKIVMELHDNGNNSVTVSVEDNGRGIPQEMKPLIFDPFYQIQKEDQAKGSGIGLSLVKHLSDILGGTIDVNDAFPNGTIFSFTFPELPLNGLKINEHPNVAISDEFIVETSGGKRNKRKNILVVDDSEEMATFIKKSLSKEYAVECAFDASQALKLLEERSFDLVVSDIMMPEIDGISFTKMLKKNVNYSHIPIILLSAKTENSVKVEGLKSGADVFIEKPFSILYLQAQINSLLENRIAILETFNRSPLASYSILTTNKSDDIFLNKLNDEIEKNLADIDFSIESLTDKLCISRSNLQRKIKSICGVTPGEYLRTYRLKKSCKYLLETDMRINEVAFEVGFNSASYFTKCFLKQYGMLPKDFVKKNVQDKGSI